MKDNQCNGSIEWRRVMQPEQVISDLRSTLANVQYIVGCLPHDEAHRSSLEQAAQAIKRIERILSSPIEDPVGKALHADAVAAYERATLPSPFGTAGVATTTAADDLLETLEDMARQHCHTSAKGETDSGALSMNAQVLRLLAKAGRFRIDRETGRMIIGYWPENDPERTAGVPGIAMADNWQQYAKDGETAQACIERHRREQDALLKLLAQAREPLTSEQIIALLPASWTGMLAQVMEFARRIERACGVKGDGRG